MLFCVHIRCSFSSSETSSSSVVAVFGGAWQTGNTAKQYYHRNVTLPLSDKLHIKRSKQWTGANRFCCAGLYFYVAQLAERRGDCAAVSLQGCERNS